MRRFDCFALRHVTRADLVAAGGGPSAARIHAEWRIEHERELDLIRKAQGLRAVW